MRIGRWILSAAFLSFQVIISAWAQECEPGLDWGQYRVVLERLMPLEFNKFAAVRCRLHETLYTDFPEVWFEVASDLQGSVQARLRVPEGASLHQQLWKMACQSPETPLIEFVPLLRTREWSLSLETCPALKGRLSNYSTETFNQVETSDGIKIYLDPLVFELVSQLGDVHAHFEMADPHQPPTDWALHVLEDLENCVIGVDPAVAFIDDRGVYIPEQWDRIRGAIRMQIADEQSFSVGSSAHLDFDGDGSPDLLILYSLFADDTREEPMGSWLRWFPGEGPERPPLRLTDPPRFFDGIESAKRLELILKGTEFNRWPIEPDTGYRHFTARILLHDGRLASSSIQFDQPD